MASSFEEEQAYGPSVVHRTRYCDLVEQPEATIQSLLNFFGEPYSRQCLESLKQGINSANVPIDFDASDSAIDPAIVERARQLSDQFQGTPQSSEISATAARNLEREFNRQVNTTRIPKEDMAGPPTLIAKLQEERDAFGAASGLDQR